MSAIRVLVADDHLIIRQGIVSMLSESSAVIVIGEAKDGLDAIEKTKELLPDIILMDLNMPKLDGVVATERIVAENPEAKVLILTVSEDSQDLIKAVKAGAKGYLLKDVDNEQLIGAIEAVCRGESIVNPALAADLLEEFRSLSKETAREAHPLITKLTGREQEVLKLIAEGLDNKGISKKTFVSESTVKNHVSNILSKLQLENRIQAAVFAERAGLIGVEDLSSTT